jgi:hypothetical protein
MKAKEDENSCEMKAPFILGFDERHSPNAVLAFVQ